MNHGFAVTGVTRFRLQFRPLRNKPQTLHYCIQGTLHSSARSVHNVWVKCGNAHMTGHAYVTGVPQNLLLRLRSDLFSALSSLFLVASSITSSAVLLLVDIYGCMIFVYSR